MVNLLENSVHQVEKKVNSFLLVAVCLWGSPASTYFVVSGGDRFRSCSTDGAGAGGGQDGLTEAQSALLISQLQTDYRATWWLGTIIGGFVPVLLFTVVMAERPGKVLDTARTQSLMHKELFRPGAGISVEFRTSTGTGPQTSTEASGDSLLLTVSDDWQSETEQGKLSRGGTADSDSLSNSEQGGYGTLRGTTPATASGLN